MHWTRQLAYFATSRDRVHRIALNSTGTGPVVGRGRRRTRTVAEESAVIVYQAAGHHHGAGLKLSVDWLYDRLYIADDNTVQHVTRTCPVAMLPPARRACFNPNVLRVGVRRSLHPVNHLTPTVAIWVHIATVGVKLLMLIRVFESIAERYASTV